MSSYDFPDPPPTWAYLLVTCGMTKGMVHGDDSDGAVDVEFPSIYYASHFAQLWPMTPVNIRTGDAVTDLNTPVTLTVRGVTDLPKRG